MLLPHHLPPHWLARMVGVLLVAFHLAAMTTAVLDARDGTRAGDGEG